MRTEADRLRSRLAEYYLGEGKDDPLIIELPKGGYVPLLRASATKSADVPSRPRYPWAVAATIAVLMVALAILTWWRFHQAAPISMAILPLENLSHNPEADDYLADGLTDELIATYPLLTASRRAPDLLVCLKASREMCARWGESLERITSLEGSVLRAGPQLRIDAQLIRVRDDFPIWSGKFDREATDIFAMQDEISRGIVNSLRLKNSGAAGSIVKPASRLRSLPARPCFRDPGQRRRKYRSPFEQAIAKENSFAPALRGSPPLTPTFRAPLEICSAVTISCKKCAQRQKRRSSWTHHFWPRLTMPGTAARRDGKWVEAERASRKRS